MSVRCWEEKETLVLVRAWATEAARAQSSSKVASAQSQTEAIHRAFLKLAGVSAKQRSLVSVTSRCRSLKFLFERIRDFNEAQQARGEPTWFQLPPASRSRVRQGWKWRHAGSNMTRNVFSTMKRHFKGLSAGLNARPEPEKEAAVPAKRKQGRRSYSAAAAAVDPAQGRMKWSYQEFMALARTLADVFRANPELEGSVGEAERTELLSRFRRHGGLRRRAYTGLQRQACSLLAAYRFIAAVNVEAHANKELLWHRRSEEERSVLATRFSEKQHVLRFMDAAMFDVLDKTLSIRASRSTPRSRKPPLEPSKRPSKRLRSQSAKVHRVTEQRRYSMSSRRTLISVKKTRDDRSYLFGPSNSDSLSFSDTSCSDDNSVGVSPRQGNHCVLRHHVRDLCGQGGCDNDPSVLKPVRRQKCTSTATRTARSDCESSLECAVVSMSAKLSQLDRQLTEARIQDNERMMLSILRACRQSSGFDPASAALAHSMLARAGANLLEIATLVGQQQEKTAKMLERLLTSLAKGDGAA